MQTIVAAEQTRGRAGKSRRPERGISVAILGQTDTLLDILNKAPCSRLSMVSVLKPLPTPYLFERILALEPDVVVVEEGQLAKFSEFLADLTLRSLQMPLVCISSGHDDRQDTTRVASVSEYATVTSPSSALDTLELVAAHGKLPERDQFYRALVIGSPSSERTHIEREIVSHAFPAIPVIAATIDAAQAWLDRHRFDALILVQDEAEGWDVDSADFVHKHHEMIPIVAMLSTPSLPTVNRLYRAGCSDVLVGAELASEKLVGDAVRRSVVGFRQIRQNYAIDTRDVLERLEAEQLNLVKAARTDSMTELPNRDVFDEALADLCSRAEQDACSFAIGIVDLDKFKSINDTKGHAAGDDALRAIADAMREALPSAALSCRIGGDEFAFLLEGVGCDEVVDHAERLRLTVAETDMHGATLSVSIGLSYVHSGCHSTPQSVLGAADAGLYAAKASGRNHVAYRSHAVSAVD